MVDGPIILIISDGWTRDLFLECLADGMLPEIKGELVDRGSLYTDVISVFPSVSLASHTTLLTGTNPSRHGIPGHRWLSLKGEKTSYIGLGAKTVNADMSLDVQTIFERVAPQIATVAVQSVINRGSERTERILGIDSNRILSRTASIATSTPRSLIVSWLPRGDVVSHFYGPRSKAVVREMQKTSRAIGGLCRKLREHNLLDSSRILFTSDHGQKSVSKICHLPQILRDLGYSANQNCASNQNHDFLVLSNGDSSAFLYSLKANMSTEQLAKLANRLVQSEGIDLSFLYAGEGCHYVYSAVGAAKVRELSGNRCEYTTIGAGDPLGMTSSHETHLIDLSNPASDCTLSEFPDVLNQYLTSRVPERSADLLLSASSDYHFGSAPRIAWRLGYHRGSHGGPTRSEMVFPAIVTSVNPGAVVANPTRSKDLISLLT